MQITPHFTLEELCRTDMSEFVDINLFEGKKKLLELTKLAHFAEEVRNSLACPMILTSGYRCPELNKAIGGSSTSQHQKAEAIDFIPKTMSAKETFDIIRASKLEYGQLILEKRGLGYIVHISMGTKRENLYSSKQGSYEKFLENNKYLSI